jgi:hypothetical protein
MTTCFGRAWPSSGQISFTINNNNKQKTYTLDRVFLDVLHFSGVQRDLVVNGILLVGTFRSNLLHSLNTFQVSIYQNPILYVQHCAVSESGLLLLHV